MQGFGKPRGFCRGQSIFRGFPCKFRTFFVRFRGCSLYALMIFYHVVTQLSIEFHTRRPLFLPRYSKTLILIIIIANTSAPFRFLSPPFCLIFPHFSPPAFPLAYKTAKPRRNRLYIRNNKKHSLPLRQKPAEAFIRGKSPPKPPPKPSFAAKARRSPRVRAPAPPSTQKSPPKRAFLVSLLRTFSTSSPRKKARRSGLFRYRKLTYEGS